jgi:RNA polymerase sigma-70 factor (ECF subfamily)
METAVTLPERRGLPALRRLLPLARHPAPPDFADVVRAHQGVVRGFLRRLCDTDATADDLAQETFLKAKRALPGYRGDGSLASWLLRIAYREFLSFRRSRAGQTTLIDIVEEVDEGSQRRTDRTLERDVRRALAGLSDDERACIAACFFDELTHEEAAAALELPLGTVKSHIARAREKLRGPLAAYAPKAAATSSPSSSTTPDPVPAAGGAR